jgi:hypothetical protein
MSRSGIDIEQMPIAVKKKPIAASAQDTSERLTQASMPNLDH